jgi:ferredoxin-NADP reductase
MEVHPLLFRRRGQRFESAVLRSRALTPTARAIEVEKPADFTFAPVQFTFLQLDTPDGVDLRAMSLAISPTRSRLEYGVRLSGSAYKHAFAALRPGDRVLIQGPLGHYILDPERPAVLIAGGIGITPLKGMAEYAADRRLPIPVRLLYSSRNVEEIAYREELKALEGANPQFQVLHTLTRPEPGTWEGRTGRIDAALLREGTAGLERPLYYLCGAPGFVEGCYEALVGLKVPIEDIRYELFHGYGQTD